MRETQFTNVLLRSSYLSGERAALELVKGYLESLRARTAEYFGIPQNDVVCLHNIHSLGQHDWEIGYNASCKEIASGDIAIGNNEPRSCVIVMCTGDVSIELGSTDSE